MFSEVWANFSMAMRLNRVTGGGLSGDRFPGRGRGGGVRKMRPVASY